MLLKSVQVLQLGANLWKTPLSNITPKIYIAPDAGEAKSETAGSAMEHEHEQSILRRQPKKNL